VAGGLGWLTLARSRRRQWDTAFAAELGEARWLVDTFVPAVTDRSVPRTEVAQRWNGGQRRLDDMQTELTRLAATAAGTQRSRRNARVSEAADALRQALSADVAVRSGTTRRAAYEADLLASRRLAQTQSDALLRAVEDRPGSGQQ
jgi:hypothetical protein